MASTDTAFVTGGSGFVGGALIRRLVEEGWTVRALARSDEAVTTVEGLGATAIRGDLATRASLRAGSSGADVVFHAAAHVGPGGEDGPYERVNVTGTKTLLSAARDAGVRRFVHVGTEASLMDGTPLIEVDETFPLALDSPAPYPRTKARAEAAVLAASETGVFETISIRPRFVWGAGDTSVLPNLVEAARGGKLAWIGGGTHTTSTTHIDNLVEAMLLAVTKGSPGAAYFVLDDDRVQWRDWISTLLRTQDVEPPTRSIPKVAGLVALKLKQLSRFEYWLSTQECTLNDRRARAELGYRSVTDRATGLDRLAA